MYYEVFSNPILGIHHQVINLPPNATNITILTYKDGTPRLIYLVPISKRDFELYDEQNKS